MPKPRRDSAARADTRPAFNRPPGARAAVAPRPTYSDEDEPRTPKRATKEKAKASPRPSPSPEKRPRRPSDRHRGAGGTENGPQRSKQKERDRAKYSSGTSTNSGTQLLSSNALAKLNAHNEQSEFEQKYEEQKRREKERKKQKQYKNLKTVETTPQRHKKQKNRNVSGAILEEGRSGEKHRRAHGRGGVNEKHAHRAERRPDDDQRKRKKRLWMIGGFLVLLLIIIVAVAVAVSNKSKKSGGGSSSSATTSDTAPAPSNDCDSSSIPPSAKGTYTDISTWLDTADFNCTYTAETISGLSVMGLNSDWDDSTQANDNVPALNKPWQYGQMPIRGVNVGGWLSLEPFITPSMFDYPASAAVVDEWTLTQKLGASAQRVLETHYSTFITKQSFIDIKNAGLDHVRIPYPYWAVTTYPGDPYLSNVAWRYLLRAIEYCRENGLRVNLDLHSVPGSQNGWAHSGHQGDIGWILGPDGASNAQRSLDIHNQLSTFFAQDRYKNVVAIYGLVNEPKMLVIPPQSVLDWNQKAISIVRGNGIEQQIVFGDGFLSLDTWDDMFHGVDDKLVMDTHQYQIFNVGQLKLTHQDKINLACSGWTGIMVTANNPSTGWGPTFDGEWSQADTDCTPNLNNVGVGSRWAGTLDTGDPSTSVTTPTCAEPPCSCAQANADPSTYSDSYKQFLKMYAEAQMHSFEQAWGWFYWTWKTESAVQWSWFLGLQAGILPEKAYAPDFKCDASVPDFGDLPESY